MGIEVYKLYSKLWLEDEIPPQKTQLREDFARKIISFINTHPSAWKFKNILQNDETYLLSYTDTTEPDELGSYSIQILHFVTDLETVLNITPYMMKNGFPLCAFEKIDPNEYSDKLNLIISKYIFSNNTELTEYEEKLMESIREFL